MENFVLMFDLSGGWHIADLLLDVDVNSWVLNNEWNFLRDSV